MLCGGGPKFFPANIASNACVVIAKKIIEHDYSIKSICSEIENEYDACMKKTFPIKVPFFGNKSQEAHAAAPYIFYGLDHFEVLIDQVMKDKDNWSPCSDNFFNKVYERVSINGCPALGPTTTEFLMIKNMFVEKKM